MDKQSKDIIKKIKKRIEMNIFTSAYLLDKEKEIDDKMAEALT